jgi:hypothetical protein
MRYISFMSPSVRKILEQVETWPEEDQEELAEYAREIEARRSCIYQLSEDERAALAQSAEDVRAGRFASDEQIAAIFKKARSART